MKHGVLKKKKIVFWICLLCAAALFFFAGISLDERDSEAQQCVQYVLISCDEPPCTCSMGWAPATAAVEIGNDVYLQMCTNYF